MSRIYDEEFLVLASAFTFVEQAQFMCEPAAAHLFVVLLPLLALL